MSTAYRGEYGIPVHTGPDAPLHVTRNRMFHKSTEGEGYWQSLLASNKTFCTVANDIPPLQQPIHYISLAALLRQ